MFTEIFNINSDLSSPYNNFTFQQIKLLMTEGKVKAKSKEDSGKHKTFKEKYMTKYFCSKNIFRF